MPTDDHKHDQALSDLLNQIEPPRSPDHVDETILRHARNKAEALQGQGKSANSWWKQQWQPALVVVSVSAIAISLSLQNFNEPALETSSGSLESAQAPALNEARQQQEFSLTTAIADTDAELDAVAQSVDNQLASNPATTDLPELLNAPAADSPERADVALPALAADQSIQTAASGQNVASAEIEEQATVVASASRARALSAASSARREPGDSFERQRRISVILTSVLLPDFAANSSNNAPAAAAIALREAFDTLQSDEQAMAQAIQRYNDLKDLNSDLSLPEDIEAALIEVE